MSLIRHHLQLLLRNKTCKFLKKEVTRIQDEYLFFFFSNLFNPGSSLGQTAKTILLPSSRAGFGLAIHIIAIKESKGLGRFLRIGREGNKMGCPYKHQNKSKHEKFFFLHMVTLQFNILYPIHSSKTRETPFVFTILKKSRFRFDNLCLKQ